MLTILAWLFCGGVALYIWHDTDREYVRWGKWIVRTLALGVVGATLLLG